MSEVDTPEEATESKNVAKNVVKNMAKNVVKNKDFKSSGSPFNTWLEEQYSRDEKGQPTGQIDTLTELAAANNVELKDYSNLNVGMQRMNIGNRLRAAARQRHGLHNVGGTWIDMEQETPRTHERDGTKIPKAKPAQEDQAEAA